MVLKTKKEVNNMIDILIKAEKWGTNANKLPVGKYKVISTGAKVKARKSMVDESKTLGYAQFTIMVGDVPTLVYRREKKIDPELANGLDYIPFGVDKEDEIYLIVKEAKDPKDGLVNYLNVESKEGETSFEIE